MESESETQRKRKRTKNTAPEQYELYLSYMENDYHFRSNTINPCLDDNYLKNKWEELTAKLNSIGQGPCLTVQEWIKVSKRFADWKNSTRAKCRKINEYKLKTGGGPEMKVELTPNEERGLACWGKVSVEGSKLVKETGGITEQPIIMTIEQETEGTTEDIRNVEIVEEYVLEKPALKKKTFSRKVPSSVQKIRQSRYETVAKSLIDSCSSTTTAQQKVLENKNNIEKERLRFDVEKFKFLNPNFEFELQL